MNLPPPLSRLLLGPDPDRHPAIGLTLLVSALYLVNAVQIVAAVSVGYASAVLAPYFLAFMLTGAVLFYGLLRSGLSQRWSDPNLVVAQSIYCAFAVALGYLTVDLHFRGVVLTFMPVILLPGQFALQPRRIRQLTVVMFLLLVGTTIVNWYVNPGEPELVGDILRCTYVTVILVAVCVVAQAVSRTRHDMKLKSEALANALSKVEHMAAHDQLTGLLNRHRMHEVLDKEWHRLQRQTRPTTLVMMDLDHFKRVNDTLGHQAGDEVLKRFATLADTYLRDADVVSRWGGEEFLVLCPDTTAEQAQIALNRLRDQVHVAPFLDSHPALQITFSAGLATLRPSESMASAIERADQTLYQAKEAGRDRFMQSP
ncbi:GGDEF domain-containing protein [Aquabacterium sp.]|uniref:GGDEF domain-containing protein n=1 Tax=Aquabacterium sp. TaxID=1872578 RepID=UPI003BAE77DF